MNLLEDKYLLFPAAFCLLSAFVITVCYLILYNSLPKELPLFYSLPWGENQLIEKQQFFILPTVLLLIGALNISLTWQLHLSQIILRRVLSLSLLVSSLIIFITAFKVIAIFI